MTSRLQKKKKFFQSKLNEEKLKSANAKAEADRLAQEKVKQEEAKAAAEKLAAEKLAERTAKRKAKEQENKEEILDLQGAEIRDLE